ncbi:MAG: hypothetical protein ACW981_02080 [Candidatus Hodarchaeales archaeon]|jgi:hypothetical protein
MTSSTLHDLIQVLEPTVEDFSEEYPELFQFWSENYQSYLKKSIKTLKKKNFRRNFQGRVVDSILVKEKPFLVLNLFAGYLGSFHAIFDNKFFLSDICQKPREDLEFLWINIDLLPESIEANCAYLQEYWGYKSYKIIQSKYSKFTKFNNGVMYHLAGNLTKIGKLTSSWEELCNQYPKSALFGIEGIMNLPLITRKDLFQWWDHFKRLIKPANIFFGSWMAAGDNWDGLITKIIFYQDVVKLKHHQPFHYGKLERLPIIESDDENILLLEAELPWNIDQIQKKIIPKIDSNNDCLVITFYSNKKALKSSLRFISSYVMEDTLQKLIGDDFQDTHYSLFGYKVWEEYFGLENKNKGNIKPGFIKILPFGFKRIL